MDTDTVLVVPTAPDLTRGKAAASHAHQEGMTTTQHSRLGPPCQAPGPPVDVVAWRRCRLLEHSFGPALADTLAHDRTDLHRLLALVDAGCPPELAAQILTPVDLPGTGTSGGMP
ncbi:hypothetical protein GCM10023341_18920 [Ornithinimicrobium tianjinense]